MSLDRLAWCCFSVRLPGRVHPAPLGRLLRSLGVSLFGRLVVFRSGGRPLGFPPPSPAFPSFLARGCALTAGRCVAHPGATLAKAGDHRRQLIGQAELLPVVLAQRSWAGRWRGRKIVLFVDNDSARHALIKGGSPIQASARLVGLFWAGEARAMSYTWTERVPSESNPADGPSRLAFDEMARLGGSWTEPVLVAAAELAGTGLRG